MLGTKTDMEGVIVIIKIQPVEAAVCDDPMRDLKRPSARNAEVDALTEARTERFSVPIQLTTGMLVPARGYIWVGLFLDQLAQRRRCETVCKFDWSKSIDDAVEDVDAEVTHGRIRLGPLWDIIDS
jgi:hypothetical protein